MLPWWIGLICDFSQDLSMLSLSIYDSGRVWLRDVLFFSSCFWKRSNLVKSTCVVWQAFGNFKKGFLKKGARKLPFHLLDTYTMEYLRSTLPDQKSFENMQYRTLVFTHTDLSITNHYCNYIHFYLWFFWIRSLMR